MGTEAINVSAGFSAGLVASIVAGEHCPAPHFTYAFECIDRDGKVQWVEMVENIVTTQGKNFLLDTIFYTTGTYTSGWYLGLLNGTAPLLADTAVTHAGWTDVTGSVTATANRTSMTAPFSTASSGGSKTATLQAFAITTGGTVSGAFMQSAITGTGGVLYSGTNFSSARTVVSGDTLNVTLTVSC